MSTQRYSLTRRGGEGYEEQHGSQATAQDLQGRKPTEEEVYNILKEAVPQWRCKARTRRKVSPRASTRPRTEGIPNETESGEAATCFFTYCAVFQSLAYRRARRTHRHNDKASSKLLTCPPKRRKSSCAAPSTVPTQSPAKGMRWHRSQSPDDKASKNNRQKYS